MTQQATGQQTVLPEGNWEVQTDTSELKFSGRGMFGLLTVRGKFNDFTGSLQVQQGESRGILTIDASSLDTKHTKRDEHLRSEDFFAVSHHPQIVFELDRLTTAGGGPLAEGVLEVKETRLPLKAPLKISLPAPDTLTLSTEIAVERAAAGITWNKMGVMRGPVKLTAALTLKRR